MSAFLIDTNILVYMYDPRDKGKQRRAFEVVDSLISMKAAVLSIQCLTELFRVIRWRLPHSLSHRDALAEVENLSLSCRVLTLTPPIFLEGCRATEDHGLSYWDALIWAAAKLNGVPYLISEDMQHGRVLENVRFLHPFHPSFDIDTLKAS